MGTPRSLLVPALIACVTGLHASAFAQPYGSPTISPVTQVASAATGTISGVVLDDRGSPLNGVVVSALGNSTAFGVTDTRGQYTLHSLTPGPYLLRAHLDGYLPGKSAIVNVRPAQRLTSSFALRRQGTADEPRIATAGTTAAAPAGSGAASGRDESETAWRLRHLKRPILKDTTAIAAAAAAEDDRWFITDSFSLIGRAMESSARMAGSFFTDPKFQGQVNLLTTGAFDSARELLKPERTHSVAYFAVGAPVGEHGDWKVRTALNQGDLSSWILAGDYLVREPARHRYQFGMTYGVHRYEGANAVALSAVAETERNVGMVYAHDQWALTPKFSIGYGANYAWYDYLQRATHLSPRFSTTIQPNERTTLRGLVARLVTAPGAQEFMPAAHAQVLPPQRTFGALSRDGFTPEDLVHLEFAVERVLDGGAIVELRTFHQQVDNQLVTVFGLRSAQTPISELGHYSVGSAGDVSLLGYGVSISRSLTTHIRGSVDYSVANASWTTRPSADRARLARWVPSALRPDRERVHDLTTSLETTLPQTATRVFFLVKMNNAYVDAESPRPSNGFDGRFDLQVNQGLPFLNFLSAEWEMLVAVRNLYGESLTETSLYDELLVARPPKRLIGGVTVKF